MEILTIKARSFKNVWTWGKSSRVKRSEFKIMPRLIIDNLGCGLDKGWLYGVYGGEK